MEDRIWDQRKRWTGKSGIWSWQDAKNIDYKRRQWAENERESKQSCASNGTWFAYSIDQSNHFFGNSAEKVKRYREHRVFEKVL